MNACLITVASHMGGHHEKFLKSCSHHQLQPIVLGRGLCYGGHGLKIKLAAQFLQESRGRYSHVLFCDAFDVVLAAGWPEIMARFRALNRSIVFSAERNCYPDAHLEAIYPATTSPYKHLNSGLWMGEIWAVREMFRQIEACHVPDGESDQRVYTALFLQRLAPMELDYNCHLFQSLHGSEDDVTWDELRGSVVNRINGSAPVIFHGNGSADMARVFAWLKL